MTVNNCIYMKCSTILILLVSLAVSSSQRINIDNIYFTVKPPEEMNQPVPVNKSVTPVLGKRYNNQNAMERSTVYIQHDKYKTPKWYEMNPDKSGVNFSKTNINVNELADMSGNLLNADDSYSVPYLNKNNVLSKLLEQPSLLRLPQVSRKSSHRKPNKSRLFAPASKQSNVDLYFSKSMFIPAQQLIRKNPNELKMIAKLVNQKAQNEARKGYSDLQLIEMFKPPSSKPYDGLYERLYNDYFRRYYANDPKWTERESSIDFMITSKPTSYDYNSFSGGLRHQPFTYTTSLPSAMNYYDYEFSFAKENVPIGVRKYNTQIINSKGDQSKQNPILKSSRTRCQCLRKRSEHKKGKTCLQNHTCDCRTSEKNDVHKNDGKNNEEKYDLNNILKEIEWISNKLS